MRRTIVVETFEAKGEASRNWIRLRPVPGQGYSTDVRVAYSCPVRDVLGPGRLIRISVVEVYRLGTLYLRAASNDFGEHLN